MQLLYKSVIQLIWHLAFEGLSDFTYLQPFERTHEVLATCPLLIFSEHISEDQKFVPAVTFLSLAIHQPIWYRAKKSGCLNASEYKCHIGRS